MELLAIQLKVNSMSLPFVDRHDLEAPVPVEALWAALLQLLGDSRVGPISSVGARLLGCQDWRPAGPRPLAEGSAIVGFHVRELRTGHLLVLAGRHRFARYELTFELEAMGMERARLSAVTHADFPGISGRFYRLLVITSGIHVVVARLMLHVVARRALRNFVV